jgi:hypothetical protein
MVMRSIRWIAYILIGVYLGGVVFLASNIPIIDNSCRAPLYAFFGTWPVWALHPLYIFRPLEEPIVMLSFKFCSK